MALETEWAISHYATGSINGFSNVVTAVWFSVFAYDNAAPDGKRGRFDGQVALPPPAMGDESFLKPDQADRSNILEWVKAALESDGVATAENAASAAYDTAVEPPQVLL
jgi:hypothetical protein